MYIYILLLFKCIVDGHVFNVELEFYFFLPVLFRQFWKKVMAIDFTPVQKVIRAISDFVNRKKQHIHISTKVINKQFWILCRCRCF